MGNILAGGTVLLFLAIVVFLTSFIEDGVADAGGFARCDDNGNTTSCESVGTSGFLSSINDIDVISIDGAPTWFNAGYALVLGGLLTLGVVLVVSGFIPTVPG